MPSCVIPTCKNKSGNENGISMHMFPYDEKLKEIWVTIVRKTRLEENWTPKRRSMICSAHFNKKDIRVTNGIKRIQKGAIPSKNVATEIIQSQDNKISDITSEDDPVASSIEFVSTQPLHEHDTSVDVDGKEADSTKVQMDTSDNFEERNLIYRIHRKIKYLHTYRHKLKILKKQNRLLVKHNKILKETLMKHVENNIEIRTIAKL